MVQNLSVLGHVRKTYFAAFCLRPMSAPCVLIEAKKEGVEKVAADKAAAEQAAFHGQ